MGLILIPLTIYALGAICVLIMSSDAKTVKEKRKVNRLILNPFVCFPLGLFSPIFISIAILDAIFHHDGNGYVNGLDFYPNRDQDRM